MKKTLLNEIDKLPLPELLELKKEVEKRITTKQKEEKKNLLAKFEKEAKAQGFELSDIVEGKPPKKKTAPKLPPKYQNPENPTQTWSGHGKRPHWIVKHLESGKLLEDLAISATP